MWIDSHCHLTHERIEGEGSPSDLVRHARKNGVDGMVTISCQITGDFKDQLSAAKANQNVWCSVGTHPHDAGLDAEQNITQQELVDLARSDPKIIGIGESGLDYFYDNAPRDKQDLSFRKHIRACLETGLPLIVHSRDAEEDTMRIIKEEAAGAPLRGLMHCFSSKPILAEQALEIGFFISFSGIVTFKQATELQGVAKTVPEDKILVETDAPFLAPTPHRGKTNRPAYVANTGAFVAALRGIEPEEMAKITSANFFAAFPKAKETWEEPQR